MRRRGILSRVNREKFIGITHEMSLNMKTSVNQSFLYRLILARRQTVHLLLVGLLGVVLSGIAHSGYAQSGSVGTVSGSVTDAVTGEAIPFANVYFLESTQAGTQTNLEGKFTLKRSKNSGDNRL